jgi:hypothetical protein
VEGVAQKSYLEELGRHRKFTLQVDKFVEEHLVSHRNHQGEMDDRNSLRRICEVP